MTEKPPRPLGRGYVSGFTLFPHIGIDWCPLFNPFPWWMTSQDYYRSPRFSIPVSDDGSKCHPKYHRLTPEQQSDVDEARRIIRYYQDLR